jgi:hypothetical protein
MSEAHAEASRERSRSGEARDDLRRAQLVVSSIAGMGLRLDERQEVGADDVVMLSMTCHGTAVPGLALTGNRRSQYVPRGRSVP